jgi:ribonuclease VapC
MIVDTSALVAILRDEPDAAAYARAIHAHPSRISATTLVETSLVLGAELHGDVDLLVSTAGIEVVPFGVPEAKLAREAYVRFGKGTGSPARLNFGDCMAYALAKATGEPLLFKGDDFTHTDVESAL